MTRKEIAAFFPRRDEAWRHHDVAALAADHSEDGELESPVGGTVRGRSAITNISIGWFSSFPNVEYFTDHLLVDGNKGAQFVRMIGTQKGDFCGLAPTGKRFEIRCAFLFFFADCKIAREIRIYDFAGMLIQLGVLKAKPAL